MLFYPKETYQLAFLMPMCIRGILYSQLYAIIVTTYSFVLKNILSSYLCMISK